MGQKLEIERDPSIVLPTAQSPLSEREIAELVQDGGTAPPAATSSTASQSVPKTAEDWTVAERKGKNKASRQSSSSSVAASRKPGSTPHPLPSSLLSHSSSSYSALDSLDEEEEEGEEVKADSPAESKTPKVNHEDDRNPVPKMAKKGTTKNFDAIRTEIIKKFRQVKPEAKTADCKQFIEDKQKTFYDLQYTADDVYEEMERLLSLEGGQILQEIMPGTHDPEEQTPRKRSRPNDNRGRDAVMVGDEGGEEDLDLASDEEAGHTKDPLGMEAQNGADPPTKETVQQCLTTMWVKTPPTSQETNNTHNGEHQ